MDLRFSDNGDIERSPSGDLAVTESTWRQAAQDAYIRVLTEPGDFLLYPTLGAEMHRLYGMQQSPATGEFGKQIILAALYRDNKFVGVPIEIKAIPTGYQSIRFDIYITVGGRDDLILSIEQDLGVS